MTITLSPSSFVVAEDYDVIIGADGHTTMQPLMYVGNDATAICDQLVKNGFRRDNVYCLHDDAPDNRQLP
jgi:hypothetical protein